jgi:hypothetical protein
MLLTKSSDVGPIVEIVVDTSVQETIKPESKEYTEANDSEFLNSLVDENGIPLSTKINADKRIVALQLRTKNPELAFNFEPVREEEVKDLNSTKTIVEKINTFVNKLKGIIIGDGFKKAIADPKTDAKLFKGGAEVYIWDKAPKEVKEAKELFDNLRKNNKKWEDVTQEQKDLLIDYLPVQLKLTHPYLKNKEGKEYENIVSIPARKSDTSKAYSMQDD